MTTKEAWKHIGDNLKEFEYLCPIIRELNRAEQITEEQAKKMHGIIQAITRKRTALTLFPAALYTPEAAFANRKALCYHLAKYGRISMKAFDKISENTGAQ